MSPANPGATETLLCAYPVHLSFPSCRYLCPVLWTCWSDPDRRWTWRQRSDALLATEEPLSICPPSIRDGLDAVVTPEPQWQGIVPAWRGIPCTIGRMRMWLPVQGNLAYRPADLLALLPARDGPHALPYIRLGVQFLLEYRVTVTLNGTDGDGASLLRLP